MPGRPIRVQACWRQALPPKRPYVSPGRAAGTDDHDPLFGRAPMIAGGVLMGHPHDGTDQAHLLDEDLAG
ncbi:hypothetical protein [Streptomyces sp. NBC_00566]|uniref:hypothetical protein n=1 Tax=Streptomyces sp. NBC_00566 TaxID=2975778 RepID=UPI002E819FC7|nr:hypothetical protein [Streptomyces sp. NBC_00566]WUB90517.1 hypothetical protein OG812_29695 [Streptomyces sp. NBC_00566]